MAGCKLQAHLADQLARRRVELQDTAFRCNTAIPGDHLDAALRRLFQRRHDRIRVVGGNGDRIDALSDQRVDYFDLAFRRRRSRAGIDDLDAAEFLCRLLCALVGGFKEAVAERFNHKRDLHVGSIRRRRHHGNGQCRAKSQLLRQLFRKFHANSPPKD
ncbi:hypothetical protein D3C80_795180 [compost metagenome]